MEQVFDIKNKFPIEVKNSSALFLQLGFKTLKADGICGIVVDQGILNNGTQSKTSWQTKIRKELLKNGLKKVIMLPSGSFQYTNFGICVLIFDRRYKAEEIIFEEGYFKTEDKGTKIKPMYYKEMGKISYDEVKLKNYSLSPKDHFNKEIKNDTNKWIKLGDVCESLQKSKRKAGDANINGEFNFYTSSIIAKKSNYNDYKNETIIIGSGGNGSIFIDNNFSCSADNF